MSLVPRRPSTVHLPLRFSPGEWALASQLTHNAAEIERERAERVLADSLRAADETKEISLRAQEEVQFKLSQRLRDVQEWTSELERKFADISEEIDGVIVYQRRVESASFSLDPTIQVTEAVLHLREGRVGIDLVNDEPQRELQRELSIARAMKNDLLKAHGVITERLRLLRKSAFHLDKELKDKADAARLDRMAKGLNEHTEEVQRFFDQPPRLDKKVQFVKDESEWIALTQRFTQEAERNVKTSQKMRIEVDSLLRQVCEDLQAQVCTTNAALEKRLWETITAKSKLEDQHLQVTIKVREMGDTIDILAKSITERDSAAALAETRMNIRNRRPNLELVKDQVERHLQVEMQDMYEAMQKLALRKFEAERVLRNLLSNQVQLEDAINVKVNTIAIDETKVLPLRKTIRVQKH